MLAGRLSSGRQTAARWRREAAEATDCTHTASWEAANITAAAELAVGLAAGGGSLEPALVADAAKRAAEALLRLATASLGRAVGRTAPGILATEALIFALATDQDVPEVVGVEAAEASVANELLRHG